VLQGRGDLDELGLWSSAWSPASSVAAATVAAIESGELGDHRRAIAAAAELTGVVLLVERELGDHRRAIAVERGRSAARARAVERGGPYDRVTDRRAGQG
jgi:hypothetical protein